MKGKRILSLLLSVVMVLSVFGGMTFTAGAAGTAKAIELVTNGEAANILGAQQSNIWFGSYKQSGSKTDGYNVEPVKWRVLSNADGKLLLLADQNLDVFFYHEKYRPTTWETCDMRKWLNDLAPYEDYDTPNFMSSAFAPGELGAILLTDLETDGSEATQDKVFLLSVDDVKNAEYGFTDDAGRLSVNTQYVQGGGSIRQGMNAAGSADYWWLRTQGAFDDRAAIVNDVGFLNTHGYDVANNGVAVRPAFDLDLSKVLFTSAAEGGKQGDGLTAVGDHSGSDRKLTLIDENRADFTATRSGIENGVYTITYSGAQTGENEKISAMIVNSDGVVTYYGVLCDAEAGENTVTVDVSDKMSDGDTLYVFNEQLNGDKKTDYASDLIKVAKAGAVEATDLRTGDTFEMGYYPQTKVTDDATIAALEAIDCTMTSYGYLKNTTETVNMTYADIAYNGEVYRKVTINEYRPFFTSGSYSNQSDNGYTTGNTYYFKWEPIVWQVLAKESDGVYVMSKTLLDSQAYNNYYEDTTWENCSLRTWLNDGFYEAAFSEDEQAKIVSVTHSNDDSPYNTSVSGGNDTTDNLWVLSYSDAKNDAYGFSTNAGTIIDARKAQGTDYAKSQGIYVASNGNSEWWLRSPGDSAQNVCKVNDYGYSDLISSVYYTDLGIRPAFKISLDAAVGTAEGSCIVTGDHRFEPTSRYCLNGCGAKNPDYKPSSAADLIQGDTFEMGYYPQTRVTDDATIEALKAIDCELTNFGWVQQANSTAHTTQPVKSYYADVVYNGEAYRKVVLEETRSAKTSDTAAAGDTTPIFFKLEPIVWRVLGKEADGVYVMSEKVIDAHEVHSFNEQTSWQDCTLRTWLNSTFYNTAFSKTEKERINATTHTNETQADINLGQAISYGPETTDHVWLPSQLDLVNPAYGFSKENPTETLMRRRADPTDYALDTSVMKEYPEVYYSSEYTNVSYITRDISDTNVRGFSYKGNTIFSARVNLTSLGIRPAFKLDLDATVGIAEGNCIVTGHRFENTSRCCLNGCGAENPDYTGTPASMLTTGDTFEMGYYPQTRVTDDDTITALEAIDCTMTNYGYMQKTNTEDQSFDPVDMTYADIRYNGEAYRKVTINEYRPYHTMLSSSKNNQEDNGYKTGTYYFKWEPVVWQVLAKESDGVYVMSKALVDSQAYNNFNKYTAWEDCSLRIRLNDGFYNAAFSANEKAKINSTTLHNDDSPYLDDLPGGNDTTDKLWVLSYNDVINSAYGFDPDPSAQDDARKAQGTDYAKCQGIYLSGTNSDWRLRTPGSDTTLVCKVLHNGSANNDGRTINTNIGVRPAFKLSLDSIVGIPEGPCIVTGDHSWNTEWSKNEAKHWHECTVCGGKKDEAEHSYGDTGADRYTCTVCNAEDAERKAAAELADKKAAFDDYKAEQSQAADDLGKEDDSDASKALITKAKEDIAAVQYEDDKSLDENKQTVNDIITQLATDLEKQRNHEALDAYKEEQSQAADDLGKEDDSDACKDLIDKAKEDIAAVQYEDGKSFDENKQAVNDIIEQLAADLEKQRNHEALDAYKEEQSQAADDLGKEDDSDACKDLIDKAKEDIAAVQYEDDKSLDENKQVVNDIIEQLTADLEKQRNHEALDDYKNEQSQAADDLGKEDDSDVCKDLIDKAKEDIAAVQYEDDKSLDENKQTVNDIITQLAADLEKQRDHEAFDAYKEDQKAAADSLAKPGDSRECADMIAAAKEAIDAVTYDDDKSLDENKAALDAAADLAGLAEDLEAQRAAEQLASDKNAFEEYRDKQLETIEALAEEGDSEACRELIEAAKAAAEELVYDESKSLEENKSALDEIVSDLKDDLAARRAADEEAAKPCKLLQALINALKGVKWSSLFRSFLDWLIAIINAIIAFFKTAVTA